MPARIWVWSRCAREPAGRGARASAHERAGCCLCGIDDSRIYFKFDSAKLRPESKQTLDQIATCAISGPAKGTHLRVVGRTDPRGTDGYNKTLGMTRADSVAAYLKGDGLMDTRMETLSKGESDADPSSAGWPFDRRVTVRVDQ